jgi:hypothetical protein
MNSLLRLIAVLGATVPVALSAATLEVRVDDAFAAVLASGAEVGGGTTGYVRFLDRDGRALAGASVVLACGREELERALTDERGDAAFRLTRPRLGSGCVLRFEAPLERSPVRVRAAVTRPRDAGAGSSLLVDPNALPLLLSADGRLGVYYTEPSQGAGAAATLDRLAAADRVLHQALGFRLGSGAVVLAATPAPTTSGPGTPFETLVVKRAEEGGGIGWGDFANVLELRARATLERRFATPDADLPAWIQEGLADRLAVRGLAGVDAVAAAERLEARALLLERDGRTSWDLLAAPPGAACARLDPDAPARVSAAVGASLALLEGDRELAELLHAPAAQRPSRALAVVLAVPERRLRAHLADWPASESVRALRRRAAELRAEGASRPASS